MVISIPTLYEDEIFYSFLSRYHEMSGNLRINNTLEDFFSNPYLKTNIYLPGYMDRLVKNFPINCQYTVEDIILKHTLYPFFTFFDSDEFSKKIFNLMINSDNNDIRNKSGTVNTKMNPIYFKFCDQCMKEDLKSHGETYWHRIHQTPGVFICPKHNTILCNSSVKINNANIIEYISPTEENCISNNKIEYSQDLKKKLYDLAKNIEFILKGNINKKSLHWYKNNYINALIIKGLASLNGSLRVEELISKFKQYYTEEFLNMIGCSIDENTYNNWLLDIFRKPRKRYHPIKHLLIINFLGYSVEEIVNNEIKYKPFGDAGWPCLNKVCHKYMDKVIENVDINYYKKEDKLVGTFKCDHCGFVYTRRGPDVDKADIYIINKVKDWGYVWKSKLKELALDSNTTISEMEAILNTDKSTIYRNAKKLGIPIYTRKDNKSNEREVDIKKDRRKSNKNYREIWSCLIKNNPDKSKTELRDLDKSTYFWLYKNDKEWLDKASPKVKKKIVSKYKIVDWEKRDNDILRLIEKSIKIDLNSDTKPEKISINSIARIINKPLLYYISTDKMPKTKVYVKSLVDDSDSYIKKKIVWAINYIYNHDNELLNISNIVKIACINYYDRCKFNDYIEEVLEGKAKNI